MIKLIAKYTLLEAYKKHLLWLIVCAVIACIAIGYYAKNLSVVEGNTAFIVFYTVFIRLAVVFMLSLYLIISETHALEKSQIQLALSLPLSRSHYMLGRLLGYATMTLIAVLFAAGVLLWFADAITVSLWAGSLLLELLLVLAVCYLLTLLFTHPVVAMSLFLAFYLFARNASEFYRHSRYLLEQGASSVDTIGLWIVKITTLLVPNLDRYAAAEMIAYGNSRVALWQLGLETAIYLLLVFVLSRIEMKRRLL